MRRLLLLLLLEIVIVLLLSVVVVLLLLLFSSRAIIISSVNFIAVEYGKRENQQTSSHAVFGKTLKNNLPERV